MSKCIEWLGTLNYAGYGLAKINKTQHRAHRLAWQLQHGSIPDKMLVLHRCDNRRCVNLEHL
ncbi:MAG: HNH endonuclease signature motif containing protein, partial [Alphaproteobacteria bacterium]